MCIKTYTNSNRGLDIHGVVENPMPHLSEEHGRSDISVTFCHVKKKVSDKDLAELGLTWSWTPILVTQVRFHPSHNRTRH